MADSRSSKHHGQDMQWPNHVIRILPDRTQKTHLEIPYSSTVSTLNIIQSSRTTGWKSALNFFNNEVSHQETLQILRGFSGHISLERLYIVYSTCSRHPRLSFKVGCFWPPTVLPPCRGHVSLSRVADYDKLCRFVSMDMV